MINNYRQTITDVFNIFAMHLPIDPLQKTEFVSFFSVRSELFDLRMITGQVIASVEVNEFQPPTIKPNPDFEFDFQPVIKAFERYFEAQDRARRIYSQLEIEKYNSQNQSTFDPNNLFGSSKQHKPPMQISLKDVVPELNINYDEIRQSPNIPNIGRASL
jgi:hypothetical protein